MNKKILIIICGPTAVGKTDVSIAVAKHLGAEIISFDSRQFFVETNIGTAKPDAEQLAAVKHHFINSHHVWEHFSAGEFADACLALLNASENKQQQFVMVGGSGLYIDALVNGMDDLPGKDEPIRQQLDQLYDEKGIGALQEKLKAFDEKYYNTVDLNNKQRLMRALEVIQLSGKPYSSFLGNSQHAFNFIPVYIALDLNRDELYKRINNRVDTMMQGGLKEECIRLMEYKTCNALKTVGYKEMFEHIEGKYSLDEAVTLIKQHTRNYAKRQLTWFRKNKNFKWFNPDDLNAIISHVDSNP
ncbi:MAG: tRNA (adenosine(37)-N6)-dimethylallyltransferase MiaA [Bacteroidia bacterium]